MNKKQISSLILDYLEKNPSSKAKDIASSINVDKTDINSCLYGILKNKVKQDRSYQWSLLADNEENKTNTYEPSNVSNSDIDLSNYFILDFTKLLVIWLKYNYSYYLQSIYIIVE